MMRLRCPRARIIVHSHIVYPPMTLTWRAAHGVYQLFADYFLGCGVAAGRFVFGDHIDQKPNFAVACNAVDQGRFFPDAAARARVPAQYGIAETQRLAGFVGVSTTRKTPCFCWKFSRLWRPPTPPGNCCWWAAARWKRKCGQAPWPATA